MVAVPHDRWGERPKAFVTLQPDAEVGAEDLIAFCRERLAHFKCPDAIAFGPLPKPRSTVSAGWVRPGVEVK